MSTIKATNIQHPSAASPNLVLAADGSVSGGDPTISGLVHIVSEQFTNQSSVIFDNCFSATYNNYRAIVSIESSTGAHVQIRLRTGGVNASANYVYQRLVQFNTTVSGQSSTSATSWIQSPSVGTTGGIATIEIGRPYQTKNTLFMTHSWGEGIYNNIVGGYHNNAGPQYDGLNFFPNTGTITGEINIYGYRNS
jgi:hypothetical protein